MLWPVANFSDIPVITAPRQQDKRELSAVEFAETRIGFVPDDKQRAVLESKAKRGILNCSRQWGKSTVTAIKAVHRAVRQAGALVVVAGPTERQSAEFLRKVKDFLRTMNIRVKGDGHNRVSVELPNGSRIVGLPGNCEGNIRGFSAVSLLIIDEAARVDESLYRALRPMLTVANGDLWLLSTPDGKRGFFHEVWESGGEDWVRFRVPATECARLTPERLAMERKALGDMWFRQEYMCEFLTSEWGMFSAEILEGAVDPGGGGWRL